MQLPSPARPGTHVASTSREKLTLRIQRGYLIALSLIALLSIGSHLLLDHLLATQRESAPTINLAGRQRMLSQRVSRFALEYTAAPTAEARSTAGRLLDESVAALASAHELLSRGDPARGIVIPQSPALRALYDVPPLALNQQVAAFVEAVRSLRGLPESQLTPEAPALQQILAAARMPLLAALDEAVKHYEADAQAQVSQLTDLQQWLLTVVLAMLALEALLIFRPMVAAVRDSHARIDAARQELESVFDGVPESILILDAALTIQGGNRAASRLWDRDLDRLVGQPITTLATDAANALRAVIRRAAFHQVHEWAAQRDDGSRFPFEYQLSPHTGDSYLLSGRDVSERREREHRLRLYESAFVNSSEPIVIFEADGRSDGLHALTYVNPAFTQTLGYAPVQVIGQPVDALLMSDADSDLRGRIARAFATRIPSVVETPVQRRDGSPLWCELTFMPTADARGGISHIVLIIRDISERRERERRAWDQANLDPLTGLPNRRLFNERLRAAVEDAERSRQPMALLFIDLDGFKAINDRHGHDGGDELLRVVARRLTGAVRSEDIVARLAGDEFTVICPRCPDREDAARIAGQIIERLTAPVEIASGEVRAGASIGIACCPADAGSVARLVKRADEAMYAAKAAGRNTWRQASDLPRADEAA